MPTEGQTARGREIGKGGYYSLYVWHHCIDCGKGRWVVFTKGKPQNLRCQSCANKQLMAGVSGENSRSWKGGRYNRWNYVYVRLYAGNFFYPMAQKNGYVLEHRLVMAKHLNRCLLPWEIVHHKGTKYPQGSLENKKDNRLENLELLPHSKYHLIDALTKRYIKQLETELHKLRKLHLALKEAQDD